MIRPALFSLVFLATVQPTFAATLRVPQDHQTIQAAVDASHIGDTILVAPGEYQERIVLKPGIILRSAGDDTQGAGGLRRAERTVIDGGGKQGTAPGVEMAAGSVLDGFTITAVGLYDAALWEKHFGSHGEELGDDEGSVQAEGTSPAVSIQGGSCIVTHCIVHQNGDVGIGILGKENTTTAPLISGNFVSRNMGGGIGVAEEAEPIIRDNTCTENLRAGIGCRKANPIITNNVCYQNIRAGIGCREGSKPVVRNNRCYQNRRAGIGIRMEGTAAVVEGNECYENEMAGIGCRDGASPILRNNICRQNKMAGIGCDGASPLVVGNRCTENAQVAIGVTGNSSVIITRNELSRTGGVPPIIAVKDGSTATIHNNRISGGGVAAILVQGQVTIRENTFTGIGDKQRQAIWVWEKSTDTISDNSIDNYLVAINANKAAVTITRNKISGFQGSAILVKDSPEPIHVYGNTGSSTDPQAKIVDLPGSSGTIESNVLKRE